MSTDPSIDEVLTDADVLVVSHGYQTFTKNQVDRLAERVNSVHVLVRYNRIADIGEYLPIRRLKPHRRSARIDRTDQPDNVTVIPMPLWYLPIDRHYRKLGEKHYEAVRETVAGLPTEFDLIHAHFTWTAGYAAVRLGQERDIPTVLTVHENEQWLAELAEDGPEGVYETWRGADAIVRVNEKDVPMLAAFNDDVYSVPNGFSRAEFPSYDRDEARETLGVSAETDLVFGLGGMRRRKRWHHLIDAMAVLDDRRTDVRCVLAGQGPEVRAFRDRVADRNLSDVVDVRGYLPQEEVALWMNAADVFCLPSASEGNPTVLFEALGCGTPYVGTRAGGVPEILPSDDYGLTCEPDRPERLVEILDEGLSREWDREAIRTYGEQFTWGRIVDQLVDEVYAEVLKEPDVQRIAGM